MSDEVKFGNLATVPLVRLVETRPTLSPKAAEMAHGRGALASLVEIRRLLGDLKILQPLTDEQKKRWEYLSAMASRITTRVKNGQTTISQMMQAAKQADGEEMFVKDFVNIIFVGHIRVRDVKRSCDTLKTYEGQITKQYCLSFANDWDDLGKVDPVDFVNALATETYGHKRYVDTQEAMEQIFRYAKNIHVTPSGNDDGYPALQNARWQS
jgi:hypothetical protein